MTDAQIFQWLGITFFAIGMGMLTNPKFIKDIMKDFQESATIMFFGGLVCMAIALPLITFHNSWVVNSSLIITILGWGALIKGFAFLMFPLQTMKMYKGVLVKENKFYIACGVVIVGIILLYLGFFA